MDQTTDLWWESRQKTAEFSQPAGLGARLLRTINQSLPGRPTMTTFAAPDRGRLGLVVDLNKYRPGRDLRKFIDAGVDAFALRIGGPTRWIMDDWGYEEDATFRPYMDQLDKLGYLRRSIGYIIHNPFEIWKTGANVHIDLINRWTSRGYLPHHLTLDHEVAHCWQNGVKIQASPYNLTGSMGAVTEAMYRTFAKLVSVYTARWFVNNYGPVEHSTYFDNVNRPELGKTRLAWLAWYPQAFNREYADFQAALGELLQPSGDQIVDYLSIGSYTPADLWQFTDRLKLPGDPTGVDCNVTMKPLDEFLSDFGLQAGEITMPPLPPEPQPVTFAGRIGIVKTTAGLNVRELPTISARAWFSLPAGAKVEIMEEKLSGSYLWYRIGARQWACAYTAPEKPRLIDVVMQG